MSAESAELRVGGVAVPHGARQRVELPLARLYTHTPMTVPVEVLRGPEPGPTLTLSATLHGDEINGMEICRRVLRRVRPEALSGTLLVVPIVNVFGFVYQSRYLPDRRDLNRSFPGSARGSLAARMAHLFLTEVLSHSSHLLDLHTAAPPRANAPQVRANLDRVDQRDMALAFNSPFVIHGRGPAGSLRNIAERRGVTSVLYEAGEPHRFDEAAIELGVAGSLAVMRHIGLLAEAAGGGSEGPMPFIARRTNWVRASQSGVLRHECALGQRVERGQLIGVIADPFGDAELRLTSPRAGVVIGRTSDPLVHRGDAVLHLAALEGGPGEDPEADAAGGDDDA